MSTELSEPLSEVRDSNAPSAFQPDRAQEGAPLSFAQERLWFLHELDPESPAYHVPVGMRLFGGLNVRALRRALEAVVRRHEILRTQYRAKQGGVVQVFGDETQILLPLVDLTNEPFELREPILQRAVSTAVRRPFDLSCDVMLRAHLWRIREQEHVLLLVLHHIAADEWSLCILLREIQVCYDAFCRGEQPGLQELPIQYVDYAVWQREWLQGERLKKLQCYWQERLDGELPELPIHSRPRGENANTSIREYEPVPGDLWAGLKELSRRENATIFMTLLAALKALIFRYGGQDQIVIGSPISGRTRIEIEPLIGFFVNTLVLRTELSGELTFLELLRRVHETVLGAFEHQEFPFEKLVEVVRPDRSAGRVPIVEAMFAVEESSERRCELSGLTVEFFEVDTGAPKFDLTFVFKGPSQNLTLVAEYKAERFARETIRRLTGHYVVLLRSIVANPRQRISRLAMLTDREAKEILCDWNRTESDYPRSATIADLFERQVERSPDALAVVYETPVATRPGEEADKFRTETLPAAGSVTTRRLTYRELNSMANRLAHRLRSMGVGSGSRVGLCVERSPEMIAGMLAILKAGGAYVPLDPSYPRERLAHMVQDSSVPVILSQKKFLGALPAGEVPLVLLDAPDGSLDAVENDDLGALARSDDLAYVMYTSGSTGQPKGVLIPNRAVVRLVCGTDYVQLGPSDRVAQVSNANFDAVTFEIWGPLLNGGAVIGLRPEIVLSPRELAARLATHDVTTLFLTTALFNQIAREKPEAFGTLRHLLFGGEAVDPKWVRQVLKGFPPGRLLHVYGPTESTTFSTWFEISEVQADALTVPIGRPIANTRVYLLDEAMQLVPVGVPGELYIGGDGLATGYLNQPELTAERFRADPFSSMPGARLYRTGDIARYRDDGAIEFVGRRDHQVKVRGFRIELGEIESVLLTHSAVGQAAVSAWPDPATGTLRLVAYSVFKCQPATSDFEELRDFLRQKLPEYMVPSVIVPVTRLPLNANGKVDRSKLPAPEYGGSLSRHAYRAPRSETEHRLSRIWGSVLDLKSVGISDNFFELGGHSLLAIQLFARVESEFGVRLPLATLFQSPTVEKLAGLISKEKPARASSLLVGLQPAGTRRPFFWIHSLGGDGGGGFFYYRKLAELLGPDQPSYGIRSPEEPFVCLEEMAAHYVRQLLAFQQRGPYFLGGFCFGGNVAFEMARQLMAGGRMVGLLVLLESAVPNSPRNGTFSNPQAMRLLMGHFQSWLAELVHQSPEQIVERVRRKSKSFGKRLSRALSGQRGSKGVQLADVLDMSEYPADYVRYATAHWQALMNYVPQRYPGCITLFRARKQPLSRLDPTLGWGQLAAGGVTVNVVPGSHEKMLEEPNVQILAAELKACLAEAQTES